jgi:hypothetical protein
LELLLSFLLDCVVQLAAVDKLELALCTLPIGSSSITKAPSSGPDLVHLCNPSSLELGKGTILADRMDRHSETRVVVALQESNNENSPNLIVSALVAKLVAKVFHWYRNLGKLAHASQQVYQKT